MAPVTNESRATTIETIEGLTVSPNTCIGKGLRQGLTALKNYDNASGGVMILLTDGGYWCGNPESGDWSSFNNDLAAIKDQNVRVITIAFSNNADQRIETLALETGGASFFVPDNSGPSDLNNAFSGALAYQPEGPMAEKSVAIVEKTFLGLSSIEVEFTIDPFANRELLLQMDFDAKGIVTISLDGDDTEFDTAEEVYRAAPLLAIGLHNLTITSPSAMAAVSLKVKHYIWVFLGCFVRAIEELILDAISKQKRTQMLSSLVTPQNFLFPQVEGKAPVDSLPLTVDTWTRF